jgi:hypothetical protein
MLSFEKQTIQARMALPDGQTAARPIEVRRNPITGRTCRITISRSEEREPGASALPNPPPFAAERSGCPFCPGALTARTPRLSPEVMLGDMATFTAPEQTAQLARPFWNDLHSY